MRGTIGPAADSGRADLGRRYGGVALIVAAALFIPASATAAPPTFTATLEYGPNESSLVGSATITNGSAEYFEFWLDQPSGMPTGIQFQSNPPGINGNCLGGVQEGRAFVACLLDPVAPAGTTLTMSFTLPEPYPVNGGAQATMIAPPGGFANTTTIPVSGPNALSSEPCVPDGADRVVINLPPGGSNTLLVGENGALILRGDGGNDVVCHVSANTLQGVTVNGTEGNDSLTFQIEGPGGLLGGNFAVDLGSGNDTLTVTGTNEDDTAALLAAAGALSYAPPVQSDPLYLDLSKGAPEDLLVALLGGVDLFGVKANKAAASGASTPKVPLTLKGGGGPDKLTGGAANDKLSGGGADDRLKGGKGKDRINGGSGDDRCSGGPGKDTEKSC
jgi:Ca2+-binding RTX toxin-like protein